MSESTDTVNLPVQTQLYAVNSLGSSENLGPDSWKSVLIEQLIIAARASVLSNLKAIILISTGETCFLEKVEYEAKQVSLCCHAGCVYVLIRSCSTNERREKTKKPPLSENPTALSAPASQKSSVLAHWNGQPASWSSLAYKEEDIILQLISANIVICFLLAILSDKKQGGWGKRNNIRCAWLLATP